MEDTLWSITKQKFPLNSSIDEHLKYFISYAVLAPSSHNTQPWAFEIENNKINVLADFSRRLPVADPTDRELYISIGCAIKNIMLSAENNGYSYEVVYFADKKRKDLIATFSFEKIKKGPSKLSEQLYRAISDRVTNRSLYDKNKKISKKILDNAKKLNTQKITAQYFSDKKDISYFSQLTEDGVKIAFSDQEFRNEIGLWLRHNWTKKGDGMPGYTIGVPGAQSILAPVIIRSPVMVPQVAKGEQIMVENSATIGIILADKDEKEVWVKIGEFFEEIALYFTSQGVAIGVLSAAIEVPEQRNKLKKYIKSTKLPSMFFRLGYTKEDALNAPRRSVDEVLVT